MGGGGGGTDLTNMYTAISRMVVGKKHKSACDKTESSMGRSRELLCALNTNEIQCHDNANLHIFFHFRHVETRYF